MGVKSDAPLYFVAARGKIHRLEEYIGTQPLRSVRAERHEREQRTTGDKDIVYDNGNAEWVSRERRYMQRTRRRNDADAGCVEDGYVEDGVRGRDECSAV